MVDSLSTLTGEISTHSRRGSAAGDPSQERNGGDEG